MLKSNYITAVILGMFSFGLMAQPIRIGIQDTIDPWFYVRMFAPTMEHLRQSLPETSFITEELSYRDIEKKAKAGQLDFIIVTSGLYAYLNESVGANHIATRHNLKFDDPAKSVGSLFVVRSESRRFQTVRDLKNASVAAISPTSFEGWTVALGEIHSQGEQAESFFKTPVFTGYSLPDVATTVLSGEAEVGILSVCELERLEETGSIPVGALRPVGVKHFPAIPCLTSTELYPDTIFAALPNAPSPLVKKITIALLTMPSVKAESDWGFSSNFAHIRQLYKELQIGPYAHLRETTFSAVISRWRWFFASFAAVLLLVLVYAVLIRRVVRIRTAALRRALAETKAAEKQAHEAREKLFQYEKLSVVGGLSSMFAHEVKQPVATLINYAGGLRMYFSDQPQDPVVEEALGEIETQSERISQIVNRVRSYSKSERRIHRPIQLPSVINQAIENFRKTSLSKDVAVMAKFEENIIVSGNALELELLFVNLLKNAAAAMRSLPQKAKRIQIQTQ